MKFGSAHLQAFERLSFDVNPLHVDPDYARRTQFGQVVVYGMCAVLQAVGHWAQGRRFKLGSISAHFSRPLLQDEDYRLEIEEASGEIVATYLRGTVTLARIKFSATEHSGSEPASASGFPPRKQALHPMPESVHFPELRYAPVLSNETLAPFGLAPGQLPSVQLSALAWASYFVGMEYPGRQALFAELKFVFDPDASSRPSPALFLRDVRGSLDDRINQVAVTGHGEGIESFTLKAFRRPEPVEYGIESVAVAAERLGHAFRGKRALVTGAGRGFGAVLAKMLAAAGAEVWLGYRALTPEATATLEQIRSRGGKAEAVVADLGSPQGSDAFGRELSRLGGEIDLLVANAFPFAEARSFQEQDPESFLSYVSGSLALTSRVLHASMPLLHSGATVVVISSAYASRPEPGFSHYVAAKCATEGLLRGLSLELPQHRFVIARPPRMLTDQTNLAFDRNPPASALDVAARLLRELQAPAGSADNLHEVDFHD
jgi:NAD(P)-dependent dehydrogenase (short-subunit alcohol dehydrogenase family)/acyl dehydratase